jgi:hypothetical protein
MPLVYLVTTSPYLDRFFSIYQLAIQITGIVLTFLLAEIMFRNIESRFRLSAEVETRSLKQKSVVLLGLVCILFGLSSFMILGERNSYLGLQEGLPKVTVAWDIDPDCARMAEWDGIPCNYIIDGSKKTILLIGDSHAAQLSEVILTAGHAKNWNVVIWTMAGCAVVFEKTTSQISNDCLNHNERTLQWIKRESPELVIISQYNGSFLPQQEIRNAVRSIMQLGSDVHLVGNTPVFPDRRFMTHPALFQQPYNFRTAIPISEMDQSDVEISDIFLAWGRKNGATTSDLTSLYCRNGYCVRSKGDSLWFSDRDHLSVDGANLALDEFKLILENYHAKSPDH